MRDLQVEIEVWDEQNALGLIGEVEDEQRYTWLDWYAGGIGLVHDDDEVRLRWDSGLIVDVITILGQEVEPGVKLRGTLVAWPGNSRISRGWGN